MNPRVLFARKLRELAVKEVPAILAAMPEEAKVALLTRHIPQFLLDSTCHLDGEARKKRMYQKIGALKDGDISYRSRARLRPNG